MENDQDSLTFRHKLILDRLTFHQNQSINYTISKLG